MKVGNEKLWAAIASYLVLALGWLILVAPVVEKQKSWTNAAAYGMIYGLAVYGVFNFTNHVMFNAYDLDIVVRDTLWGVAWLTVFTVLYYRYGTLQNM